MIWNIEADIYICFPNNPKGASICKDLLLFLLHKQLEMIQLYQENYEN